MKKLREAGAAVWNAVTTILLVIVGVLLAAAATLWYFIPKWKREEEAETKRRVSAMKATLAASHEKRDAEVKTAVAEVEKKAETLKQQDSVDVANQFIIDELNK